MTRVHRLPLTAKRAQALLDGRDEVKDLIRSMGFGRSHDVLVRFLAALDGVLPPAALQAKVTRAQGGDPEDFEQTESSSEQTESSSEQKAPNVRRPPSKADPVAELLSAARWAVEVHGNEYDLSRLDLAVCAVELTFSPKRTAS